MKKFQKWHCHLVIDAILVIVVFILFLILVLQPPSQVSDSSGDQVARDQFAKALQELTVNGPTCPICPICNNAVVETTNDNSRKVMFVRYNAILCFYRPSRTLNW